jgi:hypothetical protein
MSDCLYGGTNLEQKNYYLDEKKIRRVRSILGAKTETETEGNRCRLKLGSFPKGHSQIIGKSRRQRRCRKGFLVAKHLIDMDLYEWDVSLMPVASYRSEAIERNEAGEPFSTACYMT